MGRQLLCPVHRCRTDLAGRHVDNTAQAQIFGSDPVCMAEAAQIAMQMRPDWIDINMGCPVPKIVSNGEGSALMKDPVLMSVFPTD